MGVGQLLGHQPPYIVLGIVQIVGPVCVVGLARKLIHARVQDQANRVCFRLIAVVDEVLGQCVEQGLVGGRIGDAKIIDRLHQAPAQVVLNNAIDNGSRKPGILRRGDPGGELLANILVRAALFR